MVGCTKAWSPFSRRRSNAGDVRVQHPGDYVTFNSNQLPDGTHALGAQSASDSDRITKNNYDAAGQLLRVEKALNTPLMQDYVTYTYTPNGKQATVKDANGNLANYTYDGFDRLTRWNFPDKTSKGVASTTDYEAYTYDPVGNRLSLRKRDGSLIGYTYDALNRVTVKDVPGTVSDVYYGYDIQGPQLYARFGSSAGAGLTNTYDGFGQLTSSSNNLSGTTLTLGYQYDLAGNRTRVTYPGGTYFTSSYDAAGRQTAIVENGTTTVATMAYDALGRRSSATRGTIASTYGYDAISRPASLADDLAGTADDVTMTFGYNPASQIVNRTRSNASYAWNGYVAVNRAYAVNGLNQYVTAGTATFAYDANGNLTADGTSTFTYDSENRLTGKSGGLTIAYDPLGRLWQTWGVASGTTRYLYDGDALVAEYDGSGNLLRRYVHGADARADDPILWYEGSGLTDRRSLQVDQQGSIVSVANAGGVRLAIDSYDEYGIPASGNLGRFQYTGQAWLPDLGCYHYKARAYCPTLGRFLQTDPVGYDDQINLYAYVANDPVNHTDPTGNETGTFANGCMGDSCMNIDPGGKVHEGALKVLGTIASVGSILVSVEGIAIKGLGAFGRALGIGEKADDAVKVGATIERGALSEGQAANLARFERKLPANAGETSITAGKDGSVTMSATSPGRVPGSSATYTKTVDAAGKTTGMNKTTTLPSGEIAHIKDKFNR